LDDTIRETLAVDLDGTLLRSDMLHESFWSAVSRDWRNLYRAGMALRSGRAALKRDLAARADVDVAALPYDPEVIAYVAAWRAAGGRTALVTASDGAFAQAVAGHLGLFDEVHGSDGSDNLKGMRKAEFLRDRFGAAGYSYMGDAAADLPVWAGAATAVTVNAPESLRRAAERVAGRVEHLDTARKSVLPYLRALRPHQWLKNLLVFLPLLAAHRFDAASLGAAVLAFVAFSLVASGVYVLNDLLDLAADRAHPRKRLRPFAAGSVPIAHGGAMAAALLGLGGLVAVLLGPAFLTVMLCYFALTSAYSLYIKRRIVIDICVLAFLYTIRIVAGGVATGIDLSVWLVAFSIFLFLSLAAVKRQAELVDSARRGALTASGRGYVVDDLPIVAMIAIGSGYVSVMVMALYVTAPAVTELYRMPSFLWAICGVLLYWITNMVMVAHRGEMHDDPVVHAAKDPVSRLCLVLILAFALLASVWSP